LSLLFGGDAVRDGHHEPGIGTHEVGPADGEPGNPSALPTDRDVVAFFASDFGLTGESKRYLIKVLK
jgi:hypothetical protein